MKNWKVSSQLLLITATMSVLILAIGFIGVAGMAATTARLKTVYEDRTVPLVSLGKVSYFHLASIQRLKLVGEYDRMGAAGKLRAQEEINMLKLRRAQIDEQWNAYRSTSMTAEEQALIDIYEKHMPQFRQQVLDPVLALSLIHI